MPDQGSTQEKIIMKDHDILIGLYTNVQNLMSQVQALSIQLQSNQNETFKEFKEVAVVQTELRGEVKAVKGDLADTNTRIDKMDTRWKLGDVAIGIGTVVAIVMAWFK